MITTLIFIQTTVILIAVVCWIFYKTIQKGTFKPLPTEIPYTVRRKKIWKKSDGTVVHAPLNTIFIVVKCKFNGNVYTSFRHIPGKSPKEFEQFMAEQEFNEMRKKFNF